VSSIRPGIRAFLLVGATLLAVGAAGQESGLFAPLDEPVREPRETDEERSGPKSVATVPTWGGETLRHRLARIDFARLEATRSALQDGEPAAITLNLFDEVTFKAVNLRTSPTSAGYSISGSLEGIHLGTVTLVVNGPIVTGSVRTPLATYTIDSTRGDACHIRQVDSSTLREVGEPPPPPKLPPNPFASASVETAADDSTDDPSVVDVLVLYTPAVRDARGGIFQVHAMVDLWVAETNQAFADSGVDQELFLTRTVEVDYDEAGASFIDLRRLANPTDGYMDEAHELREKTGADLVHLVAISTDVCGIAYVLRAMSPDFERLGFGLTDHECGGLTFAHELGHNMGLRHDRYVDPSNTPFAYSHGYVNQAAFEENAFRESRWRTIMAYNFQCLASEFSCVRLGRFSNPDQEWLGDPLGVAGESSTFRTDGPADARRSLNVAREVVAEYRPAGPDLAIASVITQRAWDPGQSVTIIAAVTNQGRIDAGEATATYYRSEDSVIGPDDTPLGTFSVAALGGKEDVGNALVDTAPSDHGTYYYGACIETVEGETDTENNCTPSTRVTVGPTVSVADSRSTEGFPATFSVTASEAQPHAVAVRWEATRGTAAADLDFTEAAGTVTIPANATFATISVDTTDDDLAEGDDTFVLTLLDTSSAGGAGLVLSADAWQATGTIVDDDGALRIPDEALHDALVLALGEPEGDQFTADELAELTTLVVPYAGIESLEGLESATNLALLVLDGNDVTDLAPLGHLTGLTRLQLANNGITDIAGLEPLEGLASLRLSGNPLTDLEPLAGLTGLRVLGLDRTGISDLAPLGGLVELATLDIASNRVSSLSPLAGLHRLSTLIADFNRIADLSPLEDLTQMAWLDLWGNRITDVEPLRNMESLFQLDLDDNEVTDISPLAGMSNLVFLWAEDNRIAELPDMEEMEDLQVLTLGNNRLTDIGPLASLERLEWLILADNAITDIAALAGLTAMEELDLSRNRISDLSPLANLTRLQFLEASGNLVGDIRPLVDLTRLRELDLADNAIGNVEPLVGLTALRELNLANNRIREVEPLLENSGLRFGDRLYLQGNPLSANAIGQHVVAFEDRGVRIYYIGVSVVAASAMEGQPLEFAVRLEPEASDDVEVEWKVSSVSADVGDDLPMNQSGKITIAAGETEAMFSVSTNEDEDVEGHETIGIELELSDEPQGVALAHGTGLGLIAERDGPVADVPVFAPHSHETRVGFLRVINRGPETVVHISAIDDSGSRHATTLALDAGETVHFNSEDLETGSLGKGLSGGVGVGTGDWHLELRGIGVEVLTYMRTADGFLTSLHDLVPAGADGYEVPIFNRAANMEQVSLLRLLNGGEKDAALTITGTDDEGESSGEVRLNLAAGAARTISAADLQSGDGLEGALGLPTKDRGKWRLHVRSPVPVGVASLLESPTGHLTNLSTLPDNKTSGEGGTTHFIPLFPSASDSDGRQGFLRVINRGAAGGTVSVRARDDTQLTYPAVTLTMDANETVHFNSDDLEMGNANKDLPDGVGAGEGDWRLELVSTLDLDVLAYIRTEDGFLTSMHDTVPAVDGVHRVPTFNPGSNRNQVSLLRLINNGTEVATVTINGFDGVGASHGEVQVTVPARSVRTLDAQELETGGEGFTGALGNGVSKWWLDVESDRPIVVMSLLKSPTGHLTNLSTTLGTLPDDAE